MTDMERTLEISRHCLSRADLLAKQGDLATTQMLLQTVSAAYDAYIKMLTVAAYVHAMNQPKHDGDDD